MRATGYWVARTDRSGLSGPKSSAERKLSAKTVSWTTGRRKKDMIDSCGGMNAISRRAFMQGAVCAAAGATLTGVSTTRTSERTASGIGVGSTEAQVKAKIKGVKCATDGGFRHCYLGKFRAGRRVTDFAIKRGKVSRADVGVVID